MSLQDDDDVSRAVAELGEPDARFHVSRGRFAAKLAVGGLLLLYGVAANYYWWFVGPARFDHVITHFLLIAPPLAGLSLLVHMHRSRGLHVLVFPSGLLRLQRGEYTSFPWGEVEHVKLRVNRADGPVSVFDAAGRPVAAWVPVEVPVFQIWNAWLTVQRADGEEASFNPAVAEYDQLAEEVQRRTFGPLWARAWGQFTAGEAVGFGDLELSPTGIRTDGKFLPWREVKEVAVAQGKLSVKEAGRWLPWALKDVAGIPNLHVLLALVAEAKRVPVAIPVAPPG